VCLIGIAAAVPLGLLIGVVCLRTQGINLSIVTLAFAVGLEQILFDNPSYTGGLTGTVIRNPNLFGIDVNAVTHDNRYAIMCLAVFAVAAVGVANLRRGRSGRRLVAVRANERAAASLGVNVTGSKLYAFCLASCIASIGGILLAFMSPNIIYTSFDSASSMAAVTRAVVGGVGWLAGPLLGGLLTVGSVVTHLLNLLGPSVGLYLPLAGGVLLLATVITAPDGIAYNLWRQLSALQGVLRRPLVSVAPRLPIPRRASRAERPSDAVAALPAGAGRAASRMRPEALRVRGISVSYGGVRALDDVTLEVRPGEVVGLIGPNGAGKTTLIDAVTGFVRPAGGVSVGEATVTGWAPARLSRVGVARSFQALELFDDMSVVDNLRVAAEAHRWQSYFLDLVHPRTDPLTPVAMAAVQEFGLEPYLDERPSALPYGLRRLVGIARAVATAPSVLLLDEPAAGLSDHETAELGSLIRRLADVWGMAILLVEHDVEMVMTVCDRIYALDFGRLIASGTPAEIRRSPAVIGSYLGENDPVTAEQSAASGPDISV
jgi:sulfate-transporting ATPase